MLALLPRHLIPAETTGKRTCPDGQENVAVEVTPGSYLNIFPNQKFFLDWVPNLHETRFKSSYISSRVENMREEVKLLPARMQIANTIDLTSNKDMMLIIRDDVVLDHPSRYSICGRWSDFPQFIYISRYFYADSILAIH